MRFYEHHVHLEGAVFSEAIARINSRRTVSFVDVPFERSRESFFRKMNHISKTLLCSKEDYADALTCILDRYCKTHDYLGLIVSPGAYEYHHSGDFEEILRVLANLLADRQDLKVGLFVDLLRNRGPDACWSYLELAKKMYRTFSFVEGIDIAGDEIKYPLIGYVPHIKAAKAEGMTVRTHSGEWGSAQEIWLALDAGVDRIAHGIHSVDDPALVDELYEKKTPLDVCPTSNLMTGASKDLHELILMSSSGLNITINSDDPAVFNTSIEKEIKLFDKVINRYSHQC